jgi:hypothetical protein
VSLLPYSLLGSLQFPLLVTADDLLAARQYRYCISSMATCTGHHFFWLFINQPRVFIVP